MENLNEVSDDGPASVTTDKGTTIEYDLCFKTIGLPVNTSAYKSCLGNIIIFTLYMHYY